MNTRLLGLIGMIAAPAMTLEAARHGFQTVPNEQTDLVGALLYGLFSIGWLASMLGLWRLRATGERRWGRAVLALPILTISLAVLQSLADLLHVPTHHPFYMVTDLAWPLSMVLTFAVGVAALVARKLPGWKRFVPLYCGLSLPVVVLAMAFGLNVPTVLFDVHTVTGWALLGYVVLTTPEPARAIRAAAPARSALS